MTGLHHRFWRFLVSGSVATAVDVGGFALLGNAGVAVAAAAIASFSVAVVANYLLSSVFTFRQAPTRKGFLLFLLAASASMLINVTVTVVGSRYLGVAPLIAKMLGSAAAMLLSFWMSLRVVFRASPSA